MKRLTKSNDNGMTWFVDHDNNEINLEPCEMTVHHSRMVLDKLAVYEDAEEQGILLRLPCGIGTTVYEVENNTDACCECNDFEKGYYCDDYCGNKSVHDKNEEVYISNPQYADTPLCQKHFYEINEYVMNNVYEIFNRKKRFW